MQMLSNTEKLLVTIIGQSLRKMPYTTHSVMPISRVMNMPAERSSTRFSRTIFMSCGIEEAEVKMPATMPVIVIKSNGETFYLLF